MASSTSSTGSITTTTTMDGRQRITGLTSGLDIDSIIKASMTAEKSKLYKLQQQQQLTQWKQDAYRQVITDIKAFSDKYFDITSPSSMMSQSNYQEFKITSSSVAITATANASADKGTHTIEVTQLATAAYRATNGRLTKDIQGTKAADFTAAQGKSFTINLDGTPRTVTIDSSVTDTASLQTAIDKAVGSGKVTVGTDGTTGALTFKAVDKSGVNAITLSGPSTNSALSDLGFGDGAILSNRINEGDTLKTIASKMNVPFSFNGDKQIQMKINGADFTFDESDTLSQMMNEINQSTDAKVTIAYDQLTDTLKLDTDQTGAGSTLQITETGSTFLTSALGLSKDGQDAKLTLDGQDLTRSSNQMTVNGVTYTLSDTTDGKATVRLDQDVDAVYKNISDFVTDYNALISTLNGKLSETYDRDYPPLTDDQKSTMSATDIANWESKAKTGILANDTTMQSMLYNLRDSLIESVQGQNLNIFKIGISTGSYDEKGQLHIDEATLKKAIQDNPDGVMNLFTQSSTDYPGTTIVRTLDNDARQKRTKQEGIAYRFYDVIQDNISTLMDRGGHKGLMLEMVGMKNDTTESDNSYSKNLKKYADQISSEQTRLKDVEDRLYTKYTNLETYITQMNSQLDTLLNNFSGSGG